MPRDGDSARGGELGSLLSPGSCLRALSQAWREGQTPCRGAVLLVGKLPATCRELLVSGRVGVCSWEEGRSRPYWAPHPQALAVVDSRSVLRFAVIGWAEDRWAGADSVPRKPLGGA